MVLWLVILSTVWLVSAALFLFMALAFGVTVTENSNSTVQFIYSLAFGGFPLLTICGAVVIWTAYLKGWSTQHYLWNLLPILFLGVFAIYIFGFNASANKGGSTVLTGDPDVAPQSDSPNQEATFEIPSSIQLDVYFKKQVSQINSDKIGVTQDLEKINELRSLLQKISPQGDMMIGITGEISHTRLIFSTKNDKRFLIEFYGDRLKTPSTGFNSLPESGPNLEAELYQKVQELLQ